MFRSSRVNSCDTEEWRMRTTDDPSTDPTIGEIISNIKNVEDHGVDIDQETDTTEMHHGNNMNVKVKIETTEEIMKIDPAGTAIMKATIITTTTINRIIKTGPADLTGMAIGKTLKHMKPIRIN